MSSDQRDAKRRIDEAARALRRASLAVKIPFRHRWLYWVRYIRLARKGVMVHSRTHDAVYEDGPLRRRYERSLERINALLERRGTPGGTYDVPSFDPGELEIADLNRLMRLDVPFVLRGGLRGLPLERWNLDYLEEVAGDCPVPINEAADEPASDTSRPTKAHHYYRFRTGRLREVVDAIRSGGASRISTAEDVMHWNGGRLRQDLDIPHWERVSGWEENKHHWLRSRLMVGMNLGAQLMLQPENAFTLWHAESGDNFFCLVRGTKVWTLAHPYYTAALRPRVKKTTNYHGSNIDVREPDAVLRERGFAGYLAIPKARVTLGPGDVLRVPNHWWHTVVTAPGDYTIAATIRANCAPNRLGPAYSYLRARDERFLEMARAFAKEGRIRDEHIGYPRPPRAEPASEGRSAGAGSA